MSAMADFARMPTQKKVTVFVVIGLLIGLVYWQFGYKGLTEDLQAAKNEHATKVKTNKQLENDIKDFQDIKDDIVDLRRLIDENQKALPTEAELPAFFETLNRKVLESGIEVVRSRQLKEEPIETFFKVLIEYEIQGTFVQIKKFFASLLPKKKSSTATASNTPEERERIVSIENLSLTTPVVRNREIRLTAKFVASTYRQEEKKDPNAKPAVPAKATAPAPAPPPSAATPKGARTQTEGAIEQGDTKNRNAAGVNEAKTPAGSGADRMKGGL